MESEAKLCFEKCKNKKKLTAQFEKMEGTTPVCFLTNFLAGVLVWILGFETVLLHNNAD